MSLVPPKCVKRLNSYHYNSYKGQCNHDFGNVIPVFAKVYIKHNFKKLNGSIERESDWPNLSLSNILPEGEYILDTIDLNNLCFSCSKVDSELVGGDVKSHYGWHRLEMYDFLFDPIIIDFTEGA